MPPGVRGLQSLRNVGPLLRMVWETSPALAVSTAALRVVRALIPLATLWVGKLILDALVPLQTHGTGDSGRIWGLVGLELRWPS